MRGAKLTSCATLVVASLLVPAATHPAAATAPQPSAMPRANGPSITIRSEYAVGAVTAGCRSDEVATGGGAGVDIPSEAYLARTMPWPATGTPKGWSGAMRYFADGAPATGWVYVVCASGGAATVRSTHFADGSGNGFTSCLPGEVATGGGAEVDFVNAFLTISVPAPLSGTPTGWATRALFRVDKTPSTGTAFVVCAPAVISLTVRTASISDDTSQKRDVSCKPDEVATGGGAWTASLGRTQPVPVAGTPTGWHGHYALGPGGFTGAVYAICAAIGRPATSSTPQPSTPPVLAHTVIVKALLGRVVVTSHGTSRRLSGRSSEPVRVGSIVDTTGGQIDLTSSVSSARATRSTIDRQLRRGSPGAPKTQSATLSKGIFRVDQKSARAAVNYTLQIPSGALATCGRRYGAEHVLTRLSATSKAKKGSKLPGHRVAASRLSATSIPSAGTTSWSVVERCDGTLVTVQQGQVRVVDRGTGKPFTRSSGQGYLAPRP